jgi:hypothetical protein
VVQCDTGDQAGQTPLEFLGRQRCGRLEPGLPGRRSEKSLSVRSELRCALHGQRFASKWRSWSEFGPLCRPTREGLSVRDIAQQVGLGPTRVHQLVTSPQADCVEDPGHPAPAP